MPHIGDVEIAHVEAIGSGSSFSVTVTANIQFSNLEQQLDMLYNARIALYEINDAMDVYSAFPNQHDLFLQRASRGDKDNFLGYSPNFQLTADRSDASIEHRFTVVPSFPDMEFRALVLCVPHTATAMRWSERSRITVVVG